MSNQVIIYIIFGIAGLVIGSFLNVLVLRFDDLKTIFKVRSHCMSCRRTLAWYELIPFFSYIALRGKCRTCKKRISVQYPLVELGTALIFVLLFWKFNLTLELFVYLVISSILIIIFAYDILYQKIADILVWIALGLWIIWIIFQLIISDFQVSIILDALYGGVILGGLLAILVGVSREKWMGAGDVSLGFLLGAISGFPQVFVAIFAAFVLGALVGLGLIAFRKKEMKDAVPFAPFLITGMFIAIFLGQFIIDWYLGKFL